MHDSQLDGQSKTYNLTVSLRRSPFPWCSQFNWPLQYGIGWAFGHISYSNVQFSGYFIVFFCFVHALRSFCFSISVPNQAFLDVSNAQNPAITCGMSGIMGLGFTSLSRIDALVNKTGSSSGRSLLYNFFNDNPNEPNFMAISLQRLTDPTADVQGTWWRF